MTRGIARQLSGRRAEFAARSFLQRQGLAFEGANFSVRFGEIDLVMIDKRTSPPTRVFVEVRYRRSIELVSPQATVSYPKQQRLTAAAQLYLKRVQCPELPCRFDVIAVSGWLSRPSIRWFQAAFDSA